MRDMFTGIIEETGIVKGIKDQNNLAHLEIQALKISKEVKKGESAAIDGVCLTVANIKKNILFFDIIKETLDKTTLGGLRVGSKVNLERALKVGDRLSGHFVTGHIDAVGIIKRRIHCGKNIELQISLEKKLRRYLVPKGSICLDGVSLTAGEVKKKSFSVHLIPFTKQVTTLGLKQEGDRVNIETDILAKYLSHTRRGIG